MKLIGEKTSLVLAGAWNPAILNPTWIGSNALGIPATQPFQVGMLLPVQGMGVTGASPRLSFEGLSITASHETLIFHLTPDEPEKVAKAFDVAQKILEKLPHTPVLAMGINFEFNVGPLEGHLADTVAWAENLGDHFDDYDAKVVARDWHLGVKAAGHMVNLTFKSTAEAATILVNHHYELEGSAAKAAANLAEAGLFEKLRVSSDQIVSGLIKGNG